MDQESSTPQVPSPETPAPTAADTKASQSARSSAGFGGRELMLVGLALAGGGLITIALLMGRGSAATNVTPATASTPSTESARVRPAVKPIPWSAARRELWLGDRRKGIAYDVTANEPVGAWMKTVRPILVVRCARGAMEAFVVTDTAASIEPKTDDTP